MKAKDILIIVAIIVALLHATFTPIFITNHLNREKIDYTTHYAKGDSIDYDFIDSLNSEIYEVR